MTDLKADGKNSKKAEDEFTEVDRKQIPDNGTKAKSSFAHQRILYRHCSMVEASWTGWEFYFFCSKFDTILEYQMWLNMPECHNHRERGSDAPRKRHFSLKFSQEILPWNQDISNISHWPLLPISGKAVKKHTSINDINPSSRDKRKRVQRETYSTKSPSAMEKYDLLKTGMQLKWTQRE